MKGSYTKYLFTKHRIYHLKNNKRIDIYCQDRWFACVLDERFILDTKHKALKQLLEKEK